MMKQKKEKKKKPTYALYKAIGKAKDEDEDEDKKHGCDKEIRKRKIIPIKIKRR